MPLGQSPTGSQKLTKEFLRKGLRAQPSPPGSAHRATSGGHCSFTGRNGHPEVDASREWLEVPQRCWPAAALPRKHMAGLGIRGPAPRGGQSCFRLLGCDFSLSKSHPHLQALWGHSDL